MKTKFFTLVILFCCVCILPSYTNDCTETVSDVAKMQIDKLCPDMQPEKAARASQQLEVYPLTLLTVEL